jgi:hypothetical protein
MGMRSLSEQKRPWVTPKVVPIELARARTLILQALELLREDALASAELGRILALIDDELLSRPKIRVGRR